MKKMLTEDLKPVKPIAQMPLVKINAKGLSLNRFWLNDLIINLDTAFTWLLPNYSDFYHLNFVISNKDLITFSLKNPNVFFAKMFNQFKLWPSKPSKREFFTYVDECPCHADCPLGCTGCDHWSCSHPCDAPETYPEAVKVCCHNIYYI